MSNFWKKLPKPFLVLAPMENVTDVVFREIVATQLPRPDVFFTEFTNTDALSSKGREAAIHRFKYTENQRPIVAQIWGIHPENFYTAAQLVQEMGFDGVDINMGCPEKNVVRNGAGAALCTNPLLAKEIIEAVKAGAPKIPISVKTRIGLKTVITEEWISFLLQQKIDALTVHGRTAKQMSKVPADWNEIGKAVVLRDRIAPETTIIGNGDIQGYAQTKEMRHQHGVDGTMIGRGIFTNPWVFDKNDVPQPHDKQEYLSILLKHVQLHKEVWQTRYFEPLKKFFKMYIRDFDGASELRQQLMECQSIESVFDTLTSQ